MTELVAKVRRWVREPVAFVREVLGIEPDDWQADVLNGYATHDRVALKACKGPGKTAVEAWAGLHFMACYPHCKVIGTSITGDNLRDGLWTEFSKWMQRSPFLMSQFDWSAERIVHKQHPSTWFAAARAWPKDADKTQQANTLAGIHNDYILFLLDEVSEYPDGVVAAVEGNLSTGKVTKLIAAGNPTKSSGPLHRMCTTDRARYFVKEITGDPDDPRRAKRISLEWARDQIAAWSRDSNYVRVNVLGQFPHGGSDNYISPDLVSAAMQRSIKRADYIDAPRVLGVDVARFGDDRSVLTPRQGVVTFRQRVHRELSTMELVGQVVLFAEESKFKPDMIFVDDIGVGGGVSDRLEELGQPVMRVNASARANHPVLYGNKRVEMWGEAKDWLAAGGSLPDDPELHAELTAPTYKQHSSGAVYLESKDEMKKRGLNSPDKADSWVLTFAAPVISARMRDQNDQYGQGHRTTHEYDPYAEGGR